MRRRPSQLLAASLSVLVVLPAAFEAEATPAIVRGVPQLNVRRGAGTGHAPVATVREGEQVEVERVSGAWALIRTQRGDAGYVNTNYLNFLGATVPRESPPAEVEAATPSPPATAAPTADVQALLRRNAELETENESLRQQLALRQAAPTPLGDGDPVATRGEMQRLVQLTEEMRREIGDLRAPERSSPMPSAQSIWVLLGTGIIIGVLLGSYYGRRNERSKRNRIRF